MSVLPPSSHLWRRKWQPTPVLLPGESHGRRSLVGYSPWGLREPDMTERLHFHSLPIGVREVLALFKGVRASGKEFLLVSPLLRCSLLIQILGSHMPAALVSASFGSPPLPPSVWLADTGPSKPNSRVCPGKLFWLLQCESPAT